MIYYYYYYYYYYYFIIELTYSKTILENSLKIKPQPVALDLEKLS